mmetsp:Transcript_17511/g.36114  ORF Transcript_17511/g.36114 Transcript_17511/m.36114 type:complete len:225 (-) Transcript_17511:20-694(-)
MNTVFAAAHGRQHALGVVCIFWFFQNRIVNLDNGVASEIIPWLWCCFRVVGFCQCQRLGFGQALRVFDRRQFLLRQIDLELGFVQGRWFHDVFFAFGQSHHAQDFPSPRALACKNEFCLWGRRFAVEELTEGDKERLCPDGGGHDSSRSLGFRLETRTRRREGKRSLEERKDCQQQKSPTSVFHNPVPKQQYRISKPCFRSQCASYFAIGWYFFTSNDVCCGSR